jgi:hypothetical protein
MFNPLSASTMVTAIGRAARAAAAGDEPLTPFERGQLMSAYSATRHLAVELDAFPSELRSTADEIAAAVERTLPQLGDDPDARVLEAYARRLGLAAGAAEVGAAIADLLALCRTHRAEPWTSLRAQVRRCLRALCDREVELLATAIEAQRA